MENRKAQWQESADGFFLHAALPLTHRRRLSFSKIVDQQIFSGSLGPRKSSPISSAWHWRPPTTAWPQWVSAFFTPTLQFPHTPYLPGVHLKCSQNQWQGPGTPSSLGVGSQGAPGEMPVAGAARDCTGGMALEAICKGADSEASCVGVFWAHLERSLVRRNRC